MRSFIAIVLLTLFSSSSLLAQNEVRVVDNKGTIQYIDSSKWYRIGNNLFNKDFDGNVSIGIDTTSIVGAKLVVNGDGKLPPIILHNLFEGTNANSLLTWNSTTGAVEKVPAGTFSWLTTGNTGTVPGTNFLGTTDSNDLVIKTNNAERLRIGSNGNTGIGTSTPNEKLDVNGTINANNYTTPMQIVTGGLWDISKGASAQWSLASGVNTLTISNAKKGVYGTIIVTNSGDSTITFAGLATGKNSKVISGGNGVVTLTPIAGAVDILSFLYDGTTFWWTVGNNYN